MSAGHLLNMRTAKVQLRRGNRSKSSFRNQSAIAGKISSAVGQRMVDVSRGGGYPATAPVQLSVEQLECPSPNPLRLEMPTGRTLLKRLVL